jgi:hypothetical protein
LLLYHTNIGSTSHGASHAYVVPVLLQCISPTWVCVRCSRHGHQVANWDS